jgi:hypothetical protein
LVALKVWKEFRPMAAAMLLRWDAAARNLLDSIALIGSRTEELRSVDWAAQGAATRAKAIRPNITFLCTISSPKSDHF